MHLTNYDFFDLHALIVVLRAFPDRTELIPALKEIASYIKKESDVNKILENTVRRILLPYVSENSEKTYLAADACHNIPLLLADVKKPRKAIESMIKEYRKKYSHDFLKEELKDIR